MHVRRYYQVAGRRELSSAFENQLVQALAPARLIGLLRWAGDRISEARARPGKPIGEAGQGLEQAHSQFQRSGGHVFASLARLGGKMIRSIGLVRPDFSLMIKSAIYNLKRMSSLLEMA